MILITPDFVKLLSPRRSRIVGAMLVLMVVTFASLAQAFDRLVAWNWVYIQVLPDIMLVALILVFCKDERDIKLLFWTFGLVTAWLAYEPIYRYMSGMVVDSMGDFDYAVASTGIGAGHTGLAHHLLHGMPFLWYASMESKNMVGKACGLGLFAFCFWGVGVSGSRGGLVGLVILLFLISVFSKQRALMIPAAFAATVAMMAVLGAEYIGRMETILQLGSDGSSSQNRIEGLISGLEMLIKKPLLGVGPGCYPVVRKAWFDWGLWAHNHYGQLAGELGVLGVIAWFTFAYQYIKKSWVMRREMLNEGWIKGALTAILVTTAVRLALGMFDHSVYKFIWYFMAAIVVVTEGLRTKEAAQGTRVNE